MKHLRKYVLTISPLGGIWLLSKSSAVIREHQKFVAFSMEDHVRGKSLYFYLCTFSAAKNDFISRDTWDCNTCPEAVELFAKTLTGETQDQDVKTWYDSLKSDLKGIFRLCFLSIYDFVFNTCLNLFLFR